MQRQKYFLHGKLRVVTVIYNLLGCCVASLVIMASLVSLTSPACLPSLSSLASFCLESLAYQDC